MQPKHVMLSELATGGSLDGQQRLVLKGRFAPRNFERLRRNICKVFYLKIFAAFSP
jgi:translation initiation factor 2 beta subunit (eIF-2beta)/eIF-5